MGIKALQSVAEIPNVEHCAKPLVKLCIHGCAQEKNTFGLVPKIGNTWNTPSVYGNLSGKLEILDDSKLQEFVVLVHSDKAV